VALDGGLRRLVRRDERVAGQGRDPAAPSGPAAAPAVRQPARLGGDRRGRRGAAPVPRRHHARGGLRPRGCGLEIAPAPGPGWCGWASRPRRCGRPASTHGGWAAPGGFRLGNLAATGLGDGSVDAVLCVDAIQFSRQPDAACCELSRVHGPGGRAVLTCWEPFGQAGERRPGRPRQGRPCYTTDGRRLQQHGSARKPRLAGL
jgi:SAM-dependent methyltransferase